MKKTFLTLLICSMFFTSVTVVSANENTDVFTGDAINEASITPEITFDQVQKSENGVLLTGYALRSNETDQFNLYVNDKLVSENVEQIRVDKMPESLAQVKTASVDQVFSFSVNIDASNFSEGDNLIQARLFSADLLLCEETYRWNVQSTKVSDVVGISAYSVDDVNTTNEQSEPLKSEEKTKETPKETKSVSLGSANVEPAASLYLDSFKYNEDDNIISFNGWSMSNTTGTWMEVLIDGKLVKQGINREKRDDVIATIKGFGGIQENPLPGYRDSINVGLYRSGSHSVIIRTVNAYKVLSQKVVEFTVPGDHSKTFIDGVKLNDDTLTINGWSMSSHRGDGVWVQVLIDDQLATNNTTRTQRGDVLATIKGFGTAKQNPLPGYITNLDVSKLNSGQHKVTVRTVTAYSVLDAVSSYFTIPPENSKTQIDSISIKGNELTVSGWSMSSHRKDGVWVQVLIDDALATNESIRSKRDDVHAVIKNCGSAKQNPNPGYTAKVDISKLSAGQHKITVRTVTAYAVLNSTTSTFNKTSNSSNNGGNSTKPIVSDAGYKVHIEKAVLNNGTLDISGWALTSKKGSWIQILVDGKLMTNEAVRSPRGDVLNVFNKFDKELNNKPGFSASIDVSNLLNGTHTVVVRIADTTKVYSSASTTFKTNNSSGTITSPIKGIDVSEHNGSINWNTVSKNVDFAMIRAGWGHYKADSKFEWNLANAQANGLAVGIYHYSYALNLEEAKEECDGLIAALAGKNIQYPVFIDMEDADGYKARNGMPSNQTLQEICIYFCERLTAAGYTAGVYANLDWWTNKLENPKLDNYVKWVAQWNSSCTYTKPYQMWQYTSDGSVPGISGRVDMNYSYYAF